MEESGVVLSIRNFFAQNAQNAQNFGIFFSSFIKQLNSTFLTIFFLAKILSIRNFFAQNAQNVLSAIWKQNSTQMINCTGNEQH